MQGTGVAALTVRFCLYTRSATGLLEVHGCYRCHSVLTVEPVGSGYGGIRTGH